jgi:hypothetical protein
MSDVVLVGPHALLSFQVAAQYHAGHLNVAEAVLAPCVVTIYMVDIGVLDVRFELNSETPVQRRNGICHTTG